MSYSDLLSDINSWLQNQSAELTEERDQIIENALTFIARDLPIQPFLTQASGSFVIGSQTILRSTLTRPVAIREWSYLDANNRYVKLFVRQESYCRTFWPVEATTGDPLFYFVDTANTWRVVPTPQATYTYTLEYVQRPQLDNTVTTNWLTENAYKLLLNGCLAEAAQFVQSVDQRPELLQAAMMEYKTELERVQRAEFGVELDALKV